MNLKDYIAKVDGYPKEGIVFRDITPLMADGKAFNEATQQIVDYARNLEIDVVVGPEARGFIVGCPVAYALEIGFVPVRKKGKLPRPTIEVDYALEYGTAEIEAHKSDILTGKNYLVVDDLIATGGTLAASRDVIEQGGGIVTDFFGVIGLPELNYDKALAPTRVTTLINYGGK